MPEHSTLSRPGPPVKRISGLSVASLHTGPSRTLSGISGRVGHNDLSTPASVSRGTVVTIPTEELHMAEETHGQGYKNAKIPYQEMSSKDRKSQPWEDSSPRQEQFMSQQSYATPLPRRFNRHASDMSPTFTAENEKYMTELRQFIRQHFHILECNRFVPAPGQGGKKIRAVKCKCGGVLTEHAGISQAKIVKKQTVDLTNIAEMAIVPPELRPYFRREKLDDICPEKFPMLKWGEEAFRKTVTNTFGKIDFVNVEHKGGKKPAKYIRLCADSAVEDVFNLMQDYWKIMEPQAPNLVISVVGGAKNFKLDGRNRTTFSDGLIKTAKTTSAWLISSGFNMGVMKAVGQAVQQGQSFAWDNNRMAHRLRCIGIAPWGYIRDRKCLVETNSGQGQFYAKYRTSNVILHGEPVPLNADHTHFIFVDDGYRNRYGGVAEMRSKIEQRISAPKSDGGLEIPVVLIVVEGGIDAIEDAKSSVQHDIPVVVCSGTGRAADILAYAYTHTKTSSSGEREMSDKHLKKLREKIIDAYGKAWKAMEKETKFTNIKDSVQICCKNPDLMTVFNMNKHDELDLAILSVLLKKNSGADKHVGDTNQRLNQLRLALTWNRVDIAQEEIFREDVLWEQGSLDQVLTEAIVDDKVAFLKLILEQGIIFKEFLTMDRLNILYSKVPKFHPIFKLLHKLTGMSELNLNNVAKLLLKLLDRFDENEMSVFSDVDGAYVIDNEQEQEKEFLRPYKHLLIYAVLLYRQDLAKFCWEMGDEPVTSAIAVTRLYGAMARHITRDESNVRDMFHQYKIEFELLATDVLEECHQSDPDKAMMIVERRSPVWGEMTSLQIAAASNDQVFLSAEACQNSITTTWKQGIMSGWSKMFLAIICPLLVLCNMEITNIGTIQLKWYQKLGAFYTSPIAKFCHNLFMHLIFLGIFSYLVLVDLTPDRVTPLEIVCFIWVVSLMVDKIYVFITFPAPTLMSKLRDWYGMVNYLEALNYLLYILAFILHLLDFYQASKVLYCINSVVFILFLTKFYTASTSIGPKMVMIQRMLGELQLFIFVVLVFLLAYGIAAQGLLYSERSPSWTILRDVFYYPYWQLYGELFFDAIGDDGDGCDSDQSMGKCIQGDRDCLTYHWMVPFILAAYLMIGNILLLNLLIAIFSNVFHTVEKNSFEIWKFQMYYLVMEYNQKTFLAPPLSIFCHAALALKWLYELVCCKLKHEEQFLGRKHLEWLQIFEKEMMANYLRLRRAADQNSLDTRVQQLEKRVDMLTKLIEDEVIQDQQPELPPELTFVAGETGQRLITSRSSSVLSQAGRSYNAWPSTLDVMAVSVAEGATDGSLKNLSSTHPGPKPQAQLLRVKSGYQLIHKPTSPVLSRMKSAPNLLHGQSEKEREHIDEPVKEVKGDVLDLDKEKDDTMKDIDNDKNVGAIGGMELTEKELEKIRKKEEKELRRKKRQERKEEKRKKKEMKEINDKFDNEMNDVNRPGNTNKPDRQVTFDLDEEEAERSRPMTAPEMFRSIEIDEQENIADNSGRFEHRSAW
ncbi:transient receptor potential cation channel subfamily M member-like 2 [Mya arenaria]|uniref:transient receptor potential cation channel subfamily M member-like 2 n=1 Tax=Mya arenaria TaxID=6604 RepID=UPI0022E83197|nr:transient receptor potential cation channel subfamily M member-like 2 [Mya arenaria]XP_052773612.1 transient receptor potential cation channel subfamily M member-like 2 [Mya arenaria]